MKMMINQSVAHQRNINALFKGIYCMETYLQARSHDLQWASDERASGPSSSTLHSVLLGMIGSQKMKIVRVGDNLRSCKQMYSCGDLFLVLLLFLARFSLADHLMLEPVQFCS